jgi:hypothetical protein
MQIEYAITAGEGILLDYGIWDADGKPWPMAWVDANSGCVELGHDDYDIFADVTYRGATLIARPCPDDCETGR